MDPKTSRLERRYTCHVATVSATQHDPLAPGLDNLDCRPIERDYRRRHVQTCPLTAQPPNGRD